MTEKRTKVLGVGTPTVIGEESVMKGELSGSANVIVLGSFEGQCELDNLLTIEHSGKWVGSVKAQSAIINGMVKGDVEISQKLEIGQTGKIEGNVTASILAIAQGAIVEGDIQMLGEKRTKQFVEKRT